MNNPTENCHNKHLALQQIERAYITTITGFSYFTGLKVLIKSLRKVGTKIPLFVMVPSTSDKKLKCAVERLGVEVITCDEIKISSQNRNENNVMHWNQTFFKLNIMRLKQFKKIIYIDADMLVVNNIDHLFDFPSISATTGGKAAHPEWIEFNSGLMVMEPNESIFNQLISCIEPAIKRKKELGLGYGDQDVFNQFYPEWNADLGHNFGEVYNAECCFLDALMQSASYKSLSDVFVLHYIGANKIWNNSIVKNLRIIHGCLHNKKPYEARAYLLYLRYQYL